MTIENDFSEGMALGLTMAGRTGMPRGSKPMVELAFARAWREWPHHSQFPSVGDRRREDEWYQITHARVRSHTLNFYWDRDDIVFRQSDPSLRSTHQEMAEMISDDIPAQSWHSLVQGWLANLEDPRQVTPEPR